MKKWPYYIKLISWGMISIFALTGCSGKIAARDLQEIARTRRSPCSTFKIVSSLIALENRIIHSDDSIHKWSGEVFWNEKWNKDMDFGGAFRDSCVWYFREVIDEIGPELMQDELDGLEYGNCDISDYSMQAQNSLKEVMLVEGQGDGGMSIYGKTGMGKAEGRTDDKNVTSTAAKEIAIRLVEDYGKHTL